MAKGCLMDPTKEVEVAAPHMLVAHTFFRKQLNVSRVR
jgi:hypothetical protein